MAVESAADRLAFLSASEFGAEASYTTKAGALASAIAGIFDDPHELVVTDGRAGAADSRPTFCCRAADLPSGARGGDAGDRLAVLGTSYRVVDLVPDGQGMTRIELGAI